MAFPVLKPCVTAAVKVNRLFTAFSARRWLLSAAYTDTTLWESREKDSQNFARLANSMDKAHEMKHPVNSLDIGRFVDNISSRDEVNQTEYYLYKFRHSQNCLYFRDWTAHSWIRQCLKYGAREKALYSLKNKVQFGIFPDNFTFNLLLDLYIKDGDFKNAFSVVEEVMLQEAFDVPSTQILSLYALGMYFGSRPQLTISEERGFGASMLHCGLTQDNTIGLSAQLLGNALLGKVEMLKGIHAVFRGMPLFWGHGYLSRALDVMERVSAASGDIKLSKDTLDYVNDLLQELSSASDSESSGDEAESESGSRGKEEAVDEDDQAEQAKLPQYVSRFKELRSSLESQNKVDSASFQDLVSALAEQKLADVEKQDLEDYEKRVQAWEDDRRLLIEKEKESRAKAEKETAEKLAVSHAA